MTVLITTRKNIVALRKAKGLSQEQLAEYSNISSPLLHHLETGCQNTTIDTLRRIAIALGVSPLALGILSLSDSEIRSVIQKPSYTPPEVRPFQIGENIALLRKAKGFSQRKASGTIPCERCPPAGHRTRLRKCFASAFRAHRQRPGNLAAGPRLSGPI